MSVNKKKLIFVGIISLIILSGLIFFLSGDRGEPVHLRQTEFFMDTVIVIDIVVDEEEQGNQALNEVFTMMKTWSDKLDRHSPDSLINQLNKYGEDGIEVPSGIIKMLEKSKVFYEKSAGRFDPTVTPLLDLWGFGKEEQKVPDQQEIEHAQKRIGLDRVDIDSENNIVYLPEEMEIDLGAVAKGFIVDEAVNLFREKGIESVIVNAGGNIAVYGEKIDENRPWRLGIVNPRGNSQEIFSEYILSFKEGGLGTSGDYQRYFFEDDIRYFHLINPLTGFQVREMRSSTIYAETALQADILSTTVFMMGWQEGKELIEQLDGIEGFLVTEDEIWYSEGFAELFVE